MDFIGFPSNIDKPITSVTAQGNVILCKGVPWDNSYKHVRLYSNQTQLLTYLRTLKVQEINNAGPVKAGKFNFRTNMSSEQMIGVNYIAYQNVPYSSEWHFGFVTDVVWLSQHSCDILFELDVFQECVFTAGINPCFIERSHIAKADDTIGANVIPENLEIGEPICYRHGTVDFGEMSIIMMCTEYPSSEQPPVYNRMTFGVYNGLLQFGWNAKNFEDVTDFLNLYEDKPDAVQLIYMVPEICYNTTWTTPTVKSVSIDYRQEYGYTPKNNKIYTYPYTYVVADDNKSHTHMFKPELFDNATVKFNSQGFMNPMGGVVTTPADYAGIEGNNYLYAFTTDNFPICAWSTDTFKAWLAQNKNTMALGTLSGVMGQTVSGVGNAMIGNVGGALGNAVGAGMTIAHTMATVADHEMIPNQAKGRTTNECGATALGLNRIDVYLMRMQDSLCKVIDDYWTAFGYPIHEIKTFDPYCRSSFVYVKTVDCGFTSDAELTLLNRFRQIFNDGVTIWHTNDIGNYALENN